MRMPRPRFFPSLRGYQPRWLRGDLVAGLTVWAVLVPESLAYATIAGLPPVVGLYAAPVALVGYALLGSSRHLVVGPMSATAALSAATVGAVATSEDQVSASAALAVVVGVVALVAGLLRLGFLAGFISEPVLKGFIIGLALTIVIGQLPGLVGTERGEGGALEALWAFLTRLPDANAATAAVGAVSLAAVLLLKRFLPLLPASLVVVLLSVLAAVVLDLPDRGVEVVGTIRSGLPAFEWPGLGRDEYLALVAGGVGIALVGFAEGLGAAKTYAVRAGYAVDADRELLGLGTANLASGLSSGMVVNGSLSKTAVNSGAGARSQVSGFVVAALTLVTLLVLTGLFEQLPEATLAAVVIAAVVELVDVRALVRLHRLWTRRLGALYGPSARADFAAAVCALLGVLLFDTLPGLFIGIAVSMLLLLQRLSRPAVTELGRDPADGRWVDLERHPGAAGVPTVAVVRIESGLVFPGADHVRDRLRAVGARDGVRAVVLDLATVPFVDVTAAQMLVEVARELRARGVRLVVARDIGQVRDVLGRADADAVLHVVHTTIDEAVAAVGPR